MDFFRALKYILSVTLILSISGLIFAQEKVRNETPLKRLIATEWSSKSVGLVANNVTNIMQSDDGYIWLTTYNGIQKFDGHKTVNYDVNQLPFLRSNGFRKIYRSPFDQSIYFSSQSSGLIRYNEKEGFEKVDAKNGEIPLSLEDVIEDGNGDLWIASTNEGLSILQNDSLFKFMHPVIENTNALSLFQSQDGIIYLGTEGDGLFAIEDFEVVKQYRSSNGMLSDIVNTTSNIGDTILVGTQSGLNYILNNELYSFDFMNGESINSMLHVNNYLWIGSDNGLGRMNLQSGKTEFISSLGFIDVTRVSDVMIDAEGSIWLATGRNGLVQLKETGIINYNRFDGLENDNVNVVTEREIKNSFFIGCDDGKIFLLDSKGIQPYKIENSVAPTGIRDVYEQKDGTVWIASYKGLLRKRGDNEKFYDLNDGLPSLDLRRIFEDKNGNLWVASRSGGLIKIRNDEIVEVIDNNSGLNSDFILSIEEDINGDLYVGTHSGGVSIIKKGGGIENISLTENDQGVIVFNTHIESSGRLWVVTSTGIFLIVEGEVLKLEFDRKYKGLSLFDWLEDEHGDVWVTTNQGVIKIYNNEINKFLKDPTYEVESRMLNSFDGMYDNECTGAVRSLKSSKGKLYIPTLGGVSVISPDRMGENQDLPEVYVESLTTQDSTYSKNSNVVLSSSTIRYKFDFTALSYLAPDATQFKYKLEGFDTDFLLQSGQRSVEYTNLSPGEYTFLLFATNNHGYWTKEPAKYFFTVKPAFHETIWFYLLFSIFTFFLIYSIYKWRVRAVQKMNAKLVKVNSELDGFVYSASHDLRSPLASLLGLINLSRKDSEHIHIYLDKMEKSIKRLDDFIAEIIDFSSNERKEVVCDEVDFKATINNIVDELSFLDSDNEVKKEIEVHQSGQFVSDNRRIAVIFRNLISNALKYSDDSKDEPFLKVFVKSNSKKAEIEIEDNGIGISKEEQKEVFKMFYRATERSTGSGLGLYIILETVEKLQGKIKMESEKYEGTRFIIEIPCLERD
ncbi:two-component regulator propeller domain-containing protein [uncultured Marivirga sp.]|uniref:sensor histidine kinase n=1 Tax=uncultured Marivirga sp. TaxID=1123707 RepID=UPI0030EEED79|tara:strand:+ start:23633 stop:26677 length:3045 start_codon:yes stop_codon:yes gene_type:complete